MTRVAVFEIALIALIICNGAVAATSEVENAIQTNEFPALRPLLRGENVNVYQVCRNYRGSDSALCAAVADEYSRRNTAQAQPNRRPVAQAELVRYRSGLRTPEGLRAFDECATNPPRSGALTCLSIAQEAEIATNRKNQEEKLARQAEAQRLASEEATAREAAKDEALKRCQAENAPSLSQMGAANQVVAAIAMKQLFQQQIDDDKEAEKVSGVADLSLRHEAGTGIVNADRAIALAFDEYKQAGGSARSPEQVKQISDPCESVRQ